MTGRAPTPRVDTGTRTTVQAGVSGGERPGRVPEGIEGDAVDGWLRAHVPELAPPCTFELISGGRSNLTFGGCDARGTRFVLRRPPLGAVLESAHDMAREHRIMSMLGPTAVPVPETLGLCSEAGVNGPPFYVMRFVDGLIVRDSADAERLLAPSLRPSVGEAMIRSLVALHEVNPDLVGLGDLGRRTDYIPRQLRRWSSQWRASATSDVPALTECHERLVASIPAQQRTSIVHGDFRMDNLVLSPEGEVRAVLDWELCTLGDPLADLGMLLVNWVSPGETTDHLLSGTPTAAGGFQDRAALTARYADRTGSDTSQIAYFIAFNLWKLACIAEGIRARLEAGAMGGAAASNQQDLAHKVHGLAEAALETLKSR